jgi:hypothetical protein
MKYKTTTVEYRVIFMVVGVLNRSCTELNSTSVHILMLGVVCLTG